jgi:hypothetical protein
MAYTLGELTYMAGASGYANPSGAASYYQKYGSWPADKKATSWAAPPKPAQQPAPKPKPTSTPAPSTPPPAYTLEQLTYIAGASGNYADARGAALEYQRTGKWPAPNSQPTAPAPAQPAPPPGMTADQGNELNRAIQNIMNAYGVSEAEAAAILRGEKPRPDGAYTPQNPTGLPVAEVKPGFDWERLQEEIRAAKAREEAERQRLAFDKGTAIGQVDGTNTLDSTKYMESIMSNPQNTALYEMRRRGSIAGPKIGESVAKYLNRSVGDESGIGIPGGETIKPINTMKSGGTIPVYDGGGYISKEILDKGYDGYGGADLGRAYNKWAHETYGGSGVAPEQSSQALAKFGEAMNNFAELRDIARDVKRLNAADKEKLYTPEWRQKLSRVNQLLDIDITSGGLGNSFRDADLIKDYGTEGNRIDDDRRGSMQKSQRKAVDFMVRHILDFDTGDDPSLESSTHPDAANAGISRVVNSYMPKWYSQLNNPMFAPGQTMPLKGGGMVIGGAPHWIVDAAGNPVAAITEDGKAEAVKGHGNVEVIPLDPARRENYMERKRDGKVDGDDDNYFYAQGGMKPVNPLKGARIGSVAPPLKRPAAKRTSNAKSRTTVNVADGFRARTRGTTDHRVNNGRSKNGNVANPGASQQTVNGTTTDKDAKNVLPKVDRIGIPGGETIKPINDISIPSPVGPIMPVPEMSIPQPVGPIVPMPPVPNIGVPPGTVIAPFPSVPQPTMPMPLWNRNRAPMLMRRPIRFRAAGGPVPLAQPAGMSDMGKQMFVGSGGNRTIDNRVGGARFGSDAGARYQQGSVNIPGNPGVSVLQPWKYAPRTLMRLGDFGRTQLMSQSMAAGIPGTEFAERAAYAEPGSATTGRIFY